MGKKQTTWGGSAEETYVRLPPFNPNPRKKQFCHNWHAKSLKAHAESTPSPGQLRLLINLGVAEIPASSLEAGHMIQKALRDRERANGGV